MRNKRIRNGAILLVCCCLLLIGYPTVGESQDVQARQVVYLLDIDGTVNPALADYITKGIEKAEEKNAACVVIRMDTPGGVLTTTKSIIKEMINAKVPVVIYVAPSGSSATSAGALIAVCADVAAMAPGTNIGAAHPVSGGGQEIDSTMSDKIVNDITAYIRGIVAKKGRNPEWPEKAIRESVSITAQEALNLKVIDLIADSIPDLLEKLDGRKIEKEKREFVLKTKGATVERIVPGLRFKILDVIANPNIAYMLMMIGGLGIMMELYNPGLIFPGVAGGICLLLSFFALQVLPVNYVGILLIILAIILFILELKVQSFGLLSLGAIISLTLGSVMLFDSTEVAMQVSWSVIIPMVSAVSAFFIVLLGLVVKAWMKKPRTGQQGLVGEVGTALTDIDPEGKVAVHGEYWNARSEGRIPKGEKVRVIKVLDMEVSVTRHSGL
ncbi:MAG: nodulation protein NfeD [Deltaproteobacteria bacterium]|nr:nodulation protein NfeD [Deltaproteobacteria bacterium]